MSHLARRGMIALTGAALWAGRAHAAPTHTIEGRAFASHWRVTVPDGTDLEKHRVAIDALLAQVDRQMSPWRDDIEITRFNTSVTETAISPETATVARAALALAGDSGGWFDPTVGPLVAQWGFGRISGADVGHWQGLDVTGDSLRKDVPELTLDLCGIAKGYALDRMAAMLLERGVEDFLIDLGGELKAAGLHPSGRDWQVAVDDPRQAHDGAAVAVGPLGRDFGVAGAKLCLGRYGIWPYHRPASGPPCCGGGGLGTPG
ncbi:FAD:protein FMN transferase [Pseudorhodobacter turbinis]|uniref:FAD:protein FMN transferase n=1 Tax=Pseudorhodobacter turbinis TaxID=2500533 RepID=A0A4P8EER7_9RHOB|nr:FAD:protein FMN transferase [Pseudorhodobacter turbinis]QCO55229.1 FAD:protein FMN transferase [Pseudorhodobacter turbinis]